MPILSKRRKADLDKVTKDEVLPLAEALAKVQGFKKTKFDQTIELCMHLGIDPRQADQAIRGSVALPHGIGKSKRVIAFCKDDVAPQAKAAGAIEAGGEDLVKKVEDGWMEFDVAIASPDMMRVVSKLGRTLGPKGLMPSPKNGTVAPDVPTAVKEYAAGKVDFRNDAGGNVHGVVGKQSFSPQQLVENAEAFIATITRMKPSSTKGTYIKRVTVSGTMTPGVQVQL